MQSALCVPIHTSKWPIERICQQPPTCRENDQKLALKAAPTRIVIQRIKQQ